MLYFRWYPLVSHFNNPPQLDILVPSARRCLVTGSRLEVLLRPDHEHFDGEYNEGRAPHFYCFQSLPGGFFFPPCLLWARWRPLGAEVATARGQSRAWQGGKPLKDLLPCKEDLSLNIKASFYLTAVCRSPPTYLGTIFFFFPGDEFSPSLCASCRLEFFCCCPTLKRQTKLHS